jgi:hypothetical protein
MQNLKKRCNYLSALFLFLPAEIGMVYCS